MSIRQAVRLFKTARINRKAVLWCPFTPDGQLAIVINKDPRHIRILAKLLRLPVWNDLT